MSYITSSSYKYNLKYKGTFWFHLFAGCVAGATSRTVVAPLERIKIILYTYYMLKIPEKDRFKGFFDALANQGTKSLWRGNLTNVMRIGPSIAIRFASYDKFKYYTMPLGDNNYFGADRFLRRIMAGLFSGFVTMAITQPIDVIRVRLSTDMSRLQEQRYYKSFSHCLRTTLRSEGIYGLYKGYAISTLGLAPYLAIVFTTYDTLKSQLPQNYSETKDPIKILLGFLGVGSISGMIAYLVTHPLDTIRRRLYVNGALNNKKYYTGTLDCVYKMWRQEGLRSFYSGLTLNLIKIAPAAAIQFSVYDIFKDVVYY